MIKCVIFYLALLTIATAERGSFIKATPVACGNDSPYYECLQDVGDIPVDIALPGAGAQQLALGDDEVTSPLLLPFIFEFYAVFYSFVRINSNGFLTFDACCANCTYNGPNCNLPEPLPDAALVNAVIAAFWTDLDPTVAGGVIHLLNDSNDFRVQWSNVSQFSSTNGNTFQVHLTRSGDVWFYYRQLPVDPSNLRPIAMGIENAAGTRALSYMFLAPGNRSRPATPSRVHIRKLPPSTTTGPIITTITTTTTTTTTSSRQHSASRTVTDGNNNNNDLFIIFIYLVVFGAICLCCIGSGFAFWYRMRQRPRHIHQPIVSDTTSETNSEGSSSDNSSGGSGSSSDDDDAEPIVYAELNSFPRDDDNGANMEEVDLNDLPKQKKKK